MRVKDLSLATAIPSHYLSKILRRLVLAGLLVSQKGHGGGFLLSKAPEEIGFSDILSAVDAYPPGECTAFGWGKYDEADPCLLNDVWNQLNERVRSWATGTTLADIAEESVESWTQRIETGTI